MSDGVVVARRFRGPPDSGNGGYVCGLLARYVDGAAEVTLRLPPPLETALDVRRDDGLVELFDGERLVAQAEPTRVALSAPVGVSLDDAQAAASAYAGLAAHPFPTCFVCGPESKDGLRIFAGPVRGRDVVAAPWTAAEEFAGDDGQVGSPFVSAALDCAGAWALGLTAARPMVLGRFAVRQDVAVPAGEPLVVVGWPLGVDGRKHYAGTALYDAAGTPLAVATATWIELRATS